MNAMSWMRLALLGLALGTVGCKDKESDDPIDDTDDTDGAVDCTSAISNTVPSQNATNVFYRPLFVIGFTEPEKDKGTTFALADASGNDVALGAVTWSTDGKQASFKPTAPLAPDTQYTLKIDYSCDGGTPSELSFATSATGSEVNTEDFLGSTYAIDLSTATIVEPAGVGSLLEGFLNDFDDVIAVVPYSLEGDDLSFYGGLAGADGSQDQCQTTIAFPEAADFSENPFFEINAPDGLNLTFEGITISLLALELSGAFTPDASAIDGITLAGSVDTRALADLLEGTDICALVGTFGIQCQACPGGGNYCLSLLATDVRATKVAWDLQEITQDDIDNNPECSAE